MLMPSSGGFWRRHQSLLLVVLTLGCSGLYVACGGSDESAMEGVGDVGGSANDDAATDGQGDSTTDSKTDSNSDSNDDAPTSNDAEAGSD